MHILVFPSWYSTDPKSFAGSYFREHASALSREGHKVNVIYLENRYSINLFSKLSVGTYIENGFKTYFIRLPMLIKGLVFIYPKLISRIGFRLFEHYCSKEGMPDLLHTHSAKYAGYIASKISKRYAIPYVLTEHLSKLLKNNIPFQQRVIFREAYKNAVRLFAVSSSLAKAMKPLAVGKEIELFENMVDEKLFTIPLEPIPDKPFKFVAIGTLTQIKGYDILIKAFHQSHQHINAKLLIAGKGRERKHLQQLIEQLELENQVDLLGSLSRDEVKNLLQSSHVLVSSSFFETFGITLIEGMACGLPVLATKSGGPDTIVERETGLLVDPGDIEQLAAGMKTIRENYSSYKKDEIRKKCIEKFGKKQAIRKLLQMYSEMSRN